MLRKNTGKLIGLGLLAVGMFGTLAAYKLSTSHTQRGMKKKITPTSIEEEPIHTTVVDLKNISANEKVDARTIGVHPKASAENINAKGPVLIPAIDPTSASHEMMKDILDATGEHPRGSSALSNRRSS